LVKLPLIKKSAGIEIGKGKIKVKAKDNFKGRVKG
jgi:hypothetical protein